MQNGIVGRFVLNTGEEVSCDRCIFTIHPQEILKILPQEHLTKAFVERVKRVRTVSSVCSQCTVSWRRVVLRMIGRMILAPRSCRCFRQLGYQPTDRPEPRR